MSMTLGVHLGLGTQAVTAGGGSAPPNAFSFTDVTSAALSTEYTSNTVSPTGGSGASAISVTGGQYSINGGGFTASAGTWNPGDTVAVKGTSSGSVSTDVDVTLSIGGVSDTYRVSTVANSEASAVIVAMTGSPPDQTRRGLIDTLVGAWKSAGTWSKRDVIHVYAAQDAQAGRLNWKNPGVTYTASPQGSPTHTQDRGYPLNGTTQYIDTTFADNTAAVNWSLDSANASVYINGAGTAGASTWALGLVTSSLVRFTPDNGSNAIFRLHAGGQTSPVITGRVGNFHMNRSASNALQFYKNGSSVATATTVSTATSSENLLVGQSIGGFASDRFAMFKCGGSLTSGEVSAENTADVAFLTAIGAN